jgi:predicted PurR-regulated permease PerM
MKYTRESFLPPLWILSLLTVTIFLWVAYQVKELLVLLVLGYFIAYAIDPILSALERRKISRTIGVFVVFGVLFGVLAILTITTIPTVIAEFHKLSGNLNQYIQVGKERVGPLLKEVEEFIPGSLREGRDLNSILSSIPELSAYVSGDTFKSIGGAILNTLLKGYSLTLTLVNAALLPFIVFYLAVDLPQIHSFFGALFPVTKRRKVGEIFKEIDGYVSSFVRGQIIVCAVLFVLYTIGLGILGVDLWLLLAAISGFGNIIPYAGFLVGIVLSSLLTLVTFGDLVHLLWLWGIYAVVQFLEGTFITPRILGESVGLSPLMVILALFAGGQLFGLLGIFLAVPAAAVLKVLGKHSYGWVMHRN